MAPDEVIEIDAFGLVTLVITVIIFLDIVLAIVTMFRERREPASLWAWILVMFFIPLLGFLLWMFVGRRLTKRALGGRQVRPRDLQALRAAGGQIYDFFPSEIPLINLRVNSRTHRKLVVIDGQVGYIGGFNVGDEYLGEDPKFGYWRDTHLRVEGGAVNSIQRLLTDWNAAAPPEHRASWQERYFRAPTTTGQVALQSRPVARTPRGSGSSSGTPR